MASHLSLTPSRRCFLSAALVGLSSKAEPAITGSFVNEPQVAGHRLRDHLLSSSPTRSEKIPVVIVGGGVAGLSAAWWLKKQNFNDFVLLEMNPQVGGNSQWGQNEFTAYPWGAHYVPVPGSGLPLVRDLMEELGVLREGKWDERWLCHSPQERVFVHGRWQSGFEPEIRVDREEWTRFENRMADFAATADFKIPLPASSRFAELDRISMAAWIEANGYRSNYLRWYVDYACRDDFGAAADQTSAWMGIHYFASRAHEERGPLTWAEGNGWIVRRLRDRLASHIRCSEPAVRISRAGTSVQVITPKTRYLAEGVVFAAPSFLAPWIVEGAATVPVSYSPWITANLTLHRQPEQRGSEPAWDNVIVNSPSLGYVVATHMNLRLHNERTVWTWYHAFSGGNIRASRQQLLDSSWKQWKDFVLDDLSRAHPDIRQCVSRIDLMRFGHAMARPLPGALFHSDASWKISRLPGLFYANSDLSGYSIFEEAQFHGVSAAKAVLRKLS